MYDEKTALYAGIIALVIVGIITMGACIICKICITSKKAQRWSGLDKLFNTNSRTRSITASSKVRCTNFHFLKKTTPVFNCEPVLDKLCFAEQGRRLSPGQAITL